MNEMLMSNGGGISEPRVKEKYDAIDGLRTFACIGIVLMHVMANMKICLSSNLLTTDVIPFAGNFVLLFMMVSAFSISCGYFVRVQNGKISPNQFYKKRYIRVLPFFGLLIVVDILQTFIAEKFSLTAPMIAELYEAYADVTLAFGLLPGADIKVIGVGWFLGVIFLFYILFPFFTFLLHTKRRAWFVLILSIGLYHVVQKYFVPVKGVCGGNSNITLCLPYFILGGMIYLYRQWIVKWANKSVVSLPIRIWLIIITLAYSLVFFTLSFYKLESLSSLLLYTLWLMCAVAENASNRRATLLNNKVTRFFSGISMEIYLCHMMFFRIVEKLHLKHYINNDDWNYWVTCLLVLMGAVAFSLLWKRAERRVERVLAATTSCPSA